MISTQVVAVFSLLVAKALATGYGGGGYGGFGTGGGVPAGRSGGGHYTGGGANLPPQPYNFDYQARDEYGNVHYRQESGDQSGSVKGSYGYTDVNGLQRVVEYVADVAGFRANVRSNEPGVGDESPADVTLTASAPPAGIQDRYTRGGASVHGGGAGVYAGSSAHAGGGAAGVYGGAAKFGGGGVRSGKSGY